MAKIGLLVKPRKKRNRYDDQRLQHFSGLHKFRERVRIINCWDQALWISQQQVIKATHMCKYQNSTTHGALCMQLCKSILFTEWIHWTSVYWATSKWGAWVVWRCVKSSMWPCRGSRCEYTLIRKSLRLIAHSFPPVVQAEVVRAGPLVHCDDAWLWNDVLLQRRVETVISGHSTLEQMLGKFPITPFESHLKAKTIVIPSILPFGCRLQFFVNRFYACKKYLDWYAE